MLCLGGAGANTNASQFYVTLAPTPHLDGKHTIFGRVSKGLTVINSIGRAVTGPGDKPLQSIRVLKAYRS